VEAEKNKIEKKEKKRGYKGPIAEDLALEKKRREYKNKTVS